MSSPSQRIRRHRTSRLWPVTVVAVATAFALTGCEPGVLAPSETPAESESPEITTPPIAGDLPCTDVFTAEQLYAFNPNFAATSDQGELPGAIADIADEGGTVCAYQHVTGSDRLLIGVLQVPAGLTAPAFETVGDEGVATSTTGSVAIGVASIYFEAERDAEPVLREIAANLG